MEEKKVVFLVDLDGTVADIDEALAYRLPELRSVIVDRKESDFPAGELEKVTRSVMMKEGFFRNIPLFPEAKQNISDLQEKGGRVVFVSSPLKNAPHCIPEKIAWIEKHFGYELARSAIFCKDKTMIYGDYLIDDRQQTGILKTPFWKQLFPSRSYNATMPSEQRLPALWISHCIK